MRPDFHSGGHAMQDFEKLGQFYLGKLFDSQKPGVTDELVMYDSKDLTTHAVCVGMTGSGKTGLCVGLLEEAAIDGIPALVIDPKGDLGNLMLAFPGLQASEFKPWVDPDEAARRGLAVDDFAVQTAETWKKGLAAWGQDAARISKLRAAVDVAIYTPGSTAGLPLSVLRSFAVPSAEVLADAAALRDRISGCVSGLLGMAGIQADPMKSRDHILLANIFEQAWRAGTALDLAGLIAAVQKPPLAKVGVFDLETFYPAKERMELAMGLNNLLASPGFSTWLEGEPMDIQRLLFTPQGTPRHAIISIAHLSDTERMFVVTLLLNEMLSWMRAQSGTTSLRALLYMDEIFGYFPPSAMPPSKLPMLTLLKQARAFGVGVVLATQNPVDLDYKGLANTGTWLIGRLQTDRDKARVMDGLESAVPAGFDRQRLEKMMTQLGNRTFLLHNVHEDQPVLFQSRWTLSYLRGPLTPKQIQVLMAPRKAGAGRPEAAPAVPVRPAVESGAASARPALPAGVTEYFVRGQQPVRHYRAAVVGCSKLHFVDAKAGLDAWRPYVHVAPFSGSGLEVEWESAQPLPGGDCDLDTEPVRTAGFSELPAAALRAKNFELWAKTLKTWLYQTVCLDVYACPALKMVASTGESEGDFRARLGLILRERRDLEIEKLRRTYAPKLAMIQEQLRKAQARVEVEKSQMGQQAIQTAISIGATLLGAFFGRKTMSAGNVGRAATAMRGAGRTMQERGDIQRAGESVAAVQARLDGLQSEFNGETMRIQTAFDPAALEICTTQIRPRKTDIVVSTVALAWVG
jgi:hypothetical protein